MRAAAFGFDVRRDDPEGNLAAAETGLRAAAAEGVELLCLPEMWATSFPGPESDLAAELESARRASERLGRLAAELGLALCGSGYGAVPGEARPANRLELRLPPAPGAAPVRVYDPVLVYDKVHLFSPTAEHESFCAGRAPPPTADTPLGRLSGLICYDLRFPELTRIPFLAGAELVCIPAQWPQPRAPHFRALAVGLAITNQCFVVAANRTGSDVIGRRELHLDFPGNSLLVDPHGTVLSEGPTRTGLVLADCDLAAAREMRQRVPVARDRRPDLYLAWWT